MFNKKLNEKLNEKLSEKLIDLIYESKVLENKWIRRLLFFINIIIIIFLLLLLINLSFWLLMDLLWISIIKEFNYDDINKISSLLLWFFWIMFILFIISLATKWKWEIIKEKEELLKIIKDHLNKRLWNNYDWYVNFSIGRSKLNYKTLIREDKFSLGIRLNENDTDWDYWRFFISSKGYENLNDNIKKYFIYDKNWDWRPYYKKWDIENIEKQLDEIIKILKLKK